MVMNKESLKECSVGSMLATQKDAVTEGGKTFDSGTSKR